MSVSAVVDLVRSALCAMIAVDREKPDVRSIERGRVVGDSSHMSIQAWIDYCLLAVISQLSLGFCCNYTLTSRFCVCVLSLGRQWQSEAHLRGFLWLSDGKLL
jgi:hypothetical protein